MQTQLRMTQDIPAAGNPEQLGSKKFLDFLACLKIVGSFSAENHQSQRQQEDGDAQSWKRKQPDIYRSLL